MSKYPFLERKDTIKKDGVSLIVVTSPIPTHPDTSLIDTAIESVLKMNYPFFEMIISYDKDRKNTSSYKKYKTRVKSKYPKFKHLELDKHGHFIGTFHNALNYCKTKYFFLLQHDISLIGKFPIKECLKTSVPWNIIATHHFNPEQCEKDIPKPTHWFPILKKTKDKNLLKTYGWSERIFLSKRDWMMDKIHEYYHKGKTKDFIESIFHKEFDKLWKQQKIKTFNNISTEPKYMKIYDKFWSEWKVYNLKSSIAYHKHLHGRTAKRNTKRNTKRRTSRGGCGKGGGKKTNKNDKSLRKKYKKISSIDCAKKYPKSREKTLKCLDDKIKDLKSLESEFPQEMKIFKKEIKEYEKAILSFMKEAGKCNKHKPDMNKVKKCAEEIGKKHGNIFKDNKELTFSWTDNMRDKLQRVIDHTQKMDFGKFGKLNI
jgi:hypothetical protein